MFRYRQLRIPIPAGGGAAARRQTRVSRPTTEEGSSALTSQPTLSWQRFAEVLRFGLVHFFLARIMHQVVPDPYMDEVFHVPQAQAYCAGNFSAWDPAITTLPGLYLWSAALHRLARVVYPEVLCSITFLRCTNILLGIIAIGAAEYCIRAMHWRIERPRTLSSHVWILASSPLLFFFSQLYYTDVGSLAFVLCCYGACLGVLPAWYPQQQRIAPVTAPVATPVAATAGAVDVPTAASAAPATANLAAADLTAPPANAAIVAAAASTEESAASLLCAVTPSSLHALAMAVVRARVHCQTTA